LTPRDFIGLLK